ncbi:MAG: DUF2333 family protein [Acidiferrobacterales bacterium]
MSTLGQSFSRLLDLYHPRTWKLKGLNWTIGLVLVTVTLALTVLAMYWSREPALFDVRQAAVKLLKNNEKELVTGQTTAAALIHVVDTLLNKPGGYLSNDVTPPTVFLDNIPNWEFGVLVQVRDLAKVLRNDMSRSQSQSLEDLDLAKAEAHFNFDNDSWLIPPSESKYRDGIEAVEKYFHRLSDPRRTNTQFFARADNLHDWLATIGKRLGSLSQRLSASVGRIRINTNLAGDTAAKQSTPEPAAQIVKTPWLEIDDIFYEARGSTWALIHFLKAAEIDFRQVLRKKNAVISLRQVIRELEATQEAIWSPIILNGRGFGVVTNHSLIMANYISRANAAVIDLRNLLQEG